MANARTNTATDKQEEAREFWRQAGADSIPPSYVVWQLFLLQNKYGPTGVPQFEAAATTLLTDLAYGTDIQTLSEQLDTGMKNELGYWAGLYRLFDDKGTRYDLSVSHDDAVLVIPVSALDDSQVEAVGSLEAYNAIGKLTKATFVNGVLKLSNEQYAFTLSFTMPSSAEDVGNPNIPPENFSTATQPRCTGTVTVSSDKNSTMEVKGKRGSYTLNGVNQLDDGDPISVWLGNYLIFDVTDVNAVQQVENPLQIDVDKDTMDIAFVWGDNILGHNVVLQNNVLTCNDDLDSSMLYAARFTCSQEGQKHIELVKATSKIGPDAQRVYRGYWMNAGTTDTPPVSDPVRPMMAMGATAAPASSAAKSNLPVQTIEFKNLSKTDSTAIDLIPHGAVGSKYAITLHLEGAATGATFTWATKLDTANSTEPASHAQFTNASENGTRIVFSSLAFLATDEPSIMIPVTLTQKSDSTETPYQLQIKIRVQTLAPIIVDPPFLPPVTRGVNSSVELKAHGALGKYLWDASASKLPDGVTFDPKTHTLTCMVTDEQASQDLYTLILTVSPDSGVIMDSATVILPLTIQNAPETQGGNINYGTIIGSALGSIVLLGAIGMFIYKKVKNKSDREPDDTTRVSREMNAKIDSRLGTNPSRFLQDAQRARNEDLEPLEDSLQRARIWSERLIQTQFEQLKAQDARYTELRRESNKYADFDQESVIPAGEFSGKTRRELQAEVDRFAADFEQMRELYQTTLKTRIKIEGQTDELHTRRRDSEKERPHAEALLGK